MAPPACQGKGPLWLAASRGKCDTLSQGFHSWGFLVQFWHANMILKESIQMLWAVPLLQTEDARLLWLLIVIGKHCPLKNAVCIRVTQAEVSAESAQFRHDEADFRYRIFLHISGESFCFPSFCFHRQTSWDKGWLFLIAFWHSSCVGRLIS